MNSFYNRTTELLNALRDTQPLGFVFLHLIVNRYRSYWRDADDEGLSLWLAASENILNVIALARLLPELAETNHEHFEFLKQSMGWTLVEAAFKHTAYTNDYPYILNLWVDKQAEICALNIRKNYTGWGKWVRKDLL